MAKSKSIIRTDSLSTDRINGEADDDFILCPICSNILWKPVACKTCENAFCLKCIRLWLHEKPNVCPFNCRFEERKAPPILIKLLSKLKLDCRHKSNGCILSISYEALEKHELQECLYKLTQCPRCFEEMLKKDIDVHQQDQCLLRELTCLKCDTTYNQNQGHTESDCLKKQIDTIKEKLDASEQKPKIIQDNYDKMVQLYNRHRINDDYAKRTQSNNYSEDYAPSAPPYESLTPSPDQSGSSTIFQAATSVTPSVTPSNEPLRLSTITFAQIPQTIIKGDHVPNGYAGFNWENAYYMFESYASKNYHLQGFSNAYTKSRKCVAYNGKGESISIFLSNSRQTFGLHSFEALSIYHDDFKLTLTGFRSNIVFDTKSIILTRKRPTLFEIDWEQIDRVTLTPSLIIDTIKPKTFALTCLNLLL